MPVEEKKNAPFYLLFPGDLSFLWCFFGAAAHQSVLFLYTGVGFSVESAGLILYICPFYLELFSILYHEVSWVKAGNTPWTGHPHSHTSVMLTLTPRSNVESPLWGWVFIKGHNEIRKTHLLHLIRLHLPYVANVEKKQIIRRMKNDFIYYWGH